MPEHTDADRLEVERPLFPLEGPAVDGDVADVIVVGGGVSGCACAATLAERGARVLVISSALDVVGLPGYGPLLISPTGDWGEIRNVLEALPSCLRTAWLDAAAAPESGEAFLVVDRRVVSIQTKRALEIMPGLGFRQGLVTGLRLVPVSYGYEDVSGNDGGGSVGCNVSTQLSRDDPGGEGPGGIYSAVEVETAFGEVFRASAVVLAPGLGLGGTMSVGDEVVLGGRYGEVPATKLLEALTELGVALHRTELRVGACFGTGKKLVDEMLDLAATQGLLTRMVPARLSVDGSVNVLFDSPSSTPQSVGRGGAGGPYESGAAEISSVVDRVAALTEDPNWGRSQPSWLEEYPPAPYWSAELALQHAVVPMPVAAMGDQGFDHIFVRGLLPDGRAAAGFYLPTQGEAAVLRQFSTSAIGSGASSCPAVRFSRREDDGATAGDPCPLPDFSPAPVTPGEPGALCAADLGRTGELWSEGISSVAPYGVTIRPKSADVPTCRPPALPTPAKDPATAAVAEMLEETATRLDHVVEALVVIGLAEDGCLSLFDARIWVAGRAAGARDYIESLRSGVNVAESIAGRLLFRRERK
jgi:hypothetical protein